MGPAGASRRSDPGPDINSLMLAADQADRQRQFPQAIQLCGQILSSRPDFLPARILSAVVYLKSGYTEEAEQKFLDILGSEPNCFPAYLWLGTMYAHASRHEEAKAMAIRAVELRPNEMDAHFLLARVLFELGQLEESESALRLTLTLREDIGEAHGMLGSILQQLGHLEEAELHLLRAIELEPHIGPPYYDLVLGRKITQLDRPLLDRFQVVATSDGLRPRDRSRIEFALGKAHDDLGEYEDAIRHYDEANRLALEVMARFGMVFDPNKLSEDFRKAVLSSSFWDVAPRGTDSEEPIFIVGMMRSGTTLLEQIVSSHSQVGASGELNFWFDRIGELHADERPPTPDESRVLAEDYLKSLGRFGIEKLRVTDKTPHNFIALGWIHAIFPNARIIHCRRRLIDSCLSIYMTPFRVPPEFGHSRENIVTFAKYYEQLMDHWRQVLPGDRFMEVDYEDLVANPEKVTRNVISFVGLDWQDACLHPNLNPKAVRTPSLWQVRQPIYSGSVERWRRYEPWLGVFRELLP